MLIDICTTRSTTPKRKPYSEEFKEEVLKLASKVGVAQAARVLSVAEYQLYYWRTAALKKASTSEISALATENARLKRQLAVQAEELDILKKPPSTSRKIKNSTI